MQIPLSRGLFAEVDDEDFERLAQHKWHALGTKIIYAARKTGPRNDRKLVLMHREIAGDPAGVIVDHRDRNGLNNRRGNLRVATRSQNNCNRAVVAGQFKGVFFDRGAWRAKVQWRGVVHDLGRHATAELAARAYDAKANEVQGEFAHLNFPRGTE